MDTAWPTMPVAERFVSINGEGLHAGQFSTFIRFSGCNLSCSYCDTTWACSPECPAENVTVADLVEYVAAQGTPCVTLTGGEPLLQPLLPRLVQELTLSTPCFVEIETNGACDVAPLAILKQSAGQGRIGITLDCKSPSSGMSQRMLSGNYQWLDADDCVKFVVGSVADLEAAASVIAQHDLLTKCPVILSPVFGEIVPADIVAFLDERGLRSARVQLQLHKIIWPGVEKGV